VHYNPWAFIAWSGNLQSSNRFYSVRWNLAFQHKRTVQTPTATVLPNVMQSVFIELPFENSQILDITIVLHFHLFEKFKASKD